MGAPAPSLAKLSTADWWRVVMVAGVGTVLEWFDFYTYAQLTSVLKKVFFPKADPTAQTLLWWAVYAVGFVVRPLGALIFGSIGDIYGRQTTLRIAIVCMAIPTVIIGCLPTYSVGPYTAGIAAPILLTIMRLFQGLAMGGEFGPAIIYISELAEVHRRGRLVAAMQSCVNIGMVIATVMVMILENSLSAYNMQVWGWRIPFCMAFVTALIGYQLRAGLPEPKAFLNAARAEKKAKEAEDAANGEGSPVDPTMTAVPSTKSMAKDGSEEGADAMTSMGSEAEEAFDAVEHDEGTLTRFHGHHKSKLPVVRVLRNNILGLCAHILYMAWVSAAFYATVTWLPAQLREAGMKPVISQGIVLISMFTNAAGLYLCGLAFDKGARSIYLNTAIVVVGMSTVFGVYRGVWTSPQATDVNTLGVWFLMPLFQFVVGLGMAAVGLPMTRVYAPLERTTGFSFGYNVGYGVIGGLTPFAVSGIIDSAGANLKAYSPSFWMLAMGGASLIGCFCMHMYAPRLGKPFVGRIE